MERTSVAIRRPYAVPAISVDLQMLTVTTVMPLAAPHDLAHNFAPIHLRLSGPLRRLLTVTTVPCAREDWSSQSDDEG